MDILSNAVIVVGKFVCKCIYPKIENIVRFSSKIENLSVEIDKLTWLREDIRVMVQAAEREGYKPKPNVLKWIEDAHELENEWKAMQERIATTKRLTLKCCPKCSLRVKVSTQAQNIRENLSRLKEVGKSFGSNLVVEDYLMKRVEFIPGLSTEDQSTATRNLNKILQLLEDDKVCIIGVWGKGGVGKTTLVKNLNNELLKIKVSNSELSFGVVIWVTVPKPPIDIRKVQEQIARRLNLKVDSEGNIISIASKIYERLKQEKSFLLILDDVWEAIDLNHVGVPQPEDPSRSKIIVTSRFLSVCKQIKTHTEMNISTLDEDESWHLFIKNAGAVTKKEDIQPFAKEIARECGGLPLAITVIGTSMRGKTRVELWEDVLKSLRMSEPHNKSVEEKVYMVIKSSFDSLESQDIESSSVNKKRGDIRSCLLYCSLYPAAISTDDLIHCWWAEGFLGEHDTHEEAYNRGITMIGSLKDTCLLQEAHEIDYVKMHDVVRDVVRWIENSSGNEHNSIIRAGAGLAGISHIKVSSSVKRISFVSNEIECLPDCFTKCPETTSLLLQDNELLEDIPHGFFLSFPALRVVNLSATGIRALPCSINSLCQLRALILQNCNELKELPPIGKLYNLLLLDCDNTRLCCLPQGMDKLTNLRLLKLPVNDLKNISKGFFLKLSRLEMLNMLDSETTNLRLLNLLGPISFDEISSLHNLTSLFIRLDSSSIFNRDHTWMSRLKSFHIEIGSSPTHVPFNKSTRMISISKCEIFSNGELSSMLQLASDLYLVKCMGLRQLIAYNSFDGLKSLCIERCSCDFGLSKEGSGQFDPLPNLEHLSLISVNHLKSVHDFGQLLGLRFSKLSQLDIHFCASLTCLFNTFSVPKHLEDISITFCPQLVELLVQRGSSQATPVNSEIPRVRKLHLRNLPKLGTLGEPRSMWEHLEEHEVINCDRIEHQKLPVSIQNTNIKVRKGFAEWWSLMAVSDFYRNQPFYFTFEVEGTKESRGRNFLHQRDRVNRSSLLCCISCQMS